MTKRTAAHVLAVTAVAGSILSPWAAGAQAHVQQVKGTVALAQRSPLDPTYGTIPRTQRETYNATRANGYFGWTFQVNTKALGGAFVLSVTGGDTGSEDLDLTWYSNLTSGTSTGSSAERSANGERGTIPLGTTHGIVNMFYGSNASFTLLAYAPEPASPTVAAPLPPTPGIYANFGKGESSFATTLRARSHVVIALVDTGINPYHVAYRRPEYGVHPSEYIEGFPADAPALGLTFGSDYVKNRKADDGPVWSKVKEKKLYWIPGTNIIGGYSAYDVEGTPPGGLKSRPVIDDSGHGTGVTSVSAGGAISPTRKTPYGSNPDALIVMVEGFGTDAVKWASQQPWIDFISGSYGDQLAVPFNDAVDLTAIEAHTGELAGREYRHTAPFILRDGRTACFSAGNGLSKTGLGPDRWSSIRPTSGPSWVITVGAVSPRNDQAYTWHNVPVDVSSYGLHWAAAGPFTVDGEQNFGGTSNATPVTCGVFSKALLEARRALGDTKEGIHVALDGERVPALGAPGAGEDDGLIDDGMLSRQELQDAVLKSALPAALDVTRYTYDPIVIPDNPYWYTQEGYGVTNVASASRAIDVIFGRAPMPQRPEVDGWIETTDSIRNLFWAPPTYPKIPPAQPSSRRPTRMPQDTEVLGRHLAATGLADTVLLTGVLLITVAAIVRRYALQRD